MQGVLLAAGIGRRFANSLQAREQVADKLLNTFPGQQETILELSAKALITALPNSIAIVQPAQQMRMRLLTDLGFTVVESGSAKFGMGHAIAEAVQATHDAEGWVIALADMPLVPARLFQQISMLVTHEKAIVVPRFLGRRGQPVAFGSHWASALSALTGDIGARALLQHERITWLDWHDDCIHRDIDTVSDLSF